MTYGIVAIVKDEADRMGRIAQWLDVVPADRWTICDTGSDDGTASLIEGLGATVHRDEWVNFGHNRSLAFERARGTADWLLALDADMTVEIDEDFEPDPSVECYMIQMGSGDFSYRLPLLLRGDLPWQSVGAVHEYTTLPGRSYTSAVTDKVRIIHPGATASPEKLRWHASLLEGHEDSRSIFYLAQTYRQLGDSRALALYEKRAKMGGWPEEVFYAKYQHALILPSWPARMLALIDAWEFRPTRLEPLYELVKELNYRGKHHAALALADSASRQSVTDVLFVHQTVWDWGLDFEWSIAEWWAGDRDVAYNMMLALLANPRLPEHIRRQTEANLALRGDSVAA